MPEEHDRFADELDRMVAGHDAAGEGELAAFAREVQGIGASRIDDAQRDRIRRRLMQHASSAATPTSGGAGPLSQPTLTDAAMTNPWVRRIPAAVTPTSWRGHMVKAQTAIAIMTAVALLIVGAAWYTNQQGGDDPGPITTRYAAAPTQDVGNSQRLSVQETSPRGTPDATDMDSEWWTWPATETCDTEAHSRSGTSEVVYPEREYLPLGTAEREDAEAAARVMRGAQACGLPYVVETFLTERAYEERILEDDESVFYARQAKEIENGRALSEAYPVQNPQEFGRLTDEDPIPATPSAMERWTGGPPAINRYEPFTAVAIPSHAILLPDGRIAIPESLIAWEGTEDLSPRGAPETWPLHIAALLILSDASGQWLVDEQLPFCVGDCEYFWSEQEKIAERMRAVGTPKATPEASMPVDDRIWLACPGYDGPYTLAARDGVASDVAPPGAFDPISSWGPAVPPTIPCQHPGAEPPEIGKPIPLD